MRKIAKPQPRQSNYMGMRSSAVLGAGGTWLEPEELTYPSGGFHRRAYVRFDDGQLRVVRCSIPDTYFSIPAIATIKGKRIKGFVASKEENDKPLFTFTANKVLAKF